MNYKILVVDDEPANTRMLERLLRGQFEVFCAGGGAEALDLLVLHDFALIISDQHMPGMTGVEFLMRAAEMRPQCVRIILTGYTDASALVAAINSGVVYKYVTKPWVNTDLLQTIKRGLSHFETIRAQHLLSLENQRLRDQIKAADSRFLRLFTEMLSLKDPSAPDRAARVRETAEMIGRSLDLDQDSLEQLGIAAYMHGVADLYTPEYLTTKAGSLSAEERTDIETCRAKGLQLLNGGPKLEEVASSIRYQFELYDGGGTPHGLKGEQIPLHARIIAVAKSYDAMSSPRNALQIMTDDEAVEALRSSAGTRLDPELVETLCNVLVAV